MCYKYEEISKTLRGNNQAAADKVQDHCKSCEECNGKLWKFYGVITAEAHLKAAGFEVNHA